MAKNAFAFLTLFTVLLVSLSMVSAYTSTQDGISVNVIQELPNPVTLGSTHAVQVNITNNNGTAIILSWADTAATSGITATVPANSTLADGTSVILNLVYSIPTGFNGTVDHKVDLGAFIGSTNIANFHPYSTANYSNTVTSTPTPTPSTYNFCEINGKVGDLEIVDVTFNNLGEGEDEEWFLLDEVEIEVEVENTNNTENVRNVLVEIKILDDNDEDVTKDFDFDDEEINVNTIKDDESEVVIFKIKEVPAGLEAGNYKVYIKAYSEDEEDEQCVAEAASKYLDKELYQRIEVTREDDPAVIVKFDQFSLDTTCGSKNVELPLSVYNLGSDKEDSVLVTVENYKLGISEKIVIDNLKSGKKKDVLFLLNIPEQTTGTSYSLDIVTYYDYDDDEEEMAESSYGENSEDDLDQDFTVKLKIISCQGPEPMIAAELVSTSRAVGEDLIVKAFVTNRGEDNDFVMSVSGFEDWAELVSVSPQSLSIDKDDAEEVLITLRPTAAGTQSFKINTIVDGETYDQTVSVAISEESGLFSGISNVILYSIIGIAALLILIFLVLIIKIAAKPRKAQF